MMTDLKYPLKSNTIPFWAVPIIAGLIPLIIFYANYYVRRDVYDLHHAMLGLLYSVLLTGVLTDAIKDAVGWPRPDFFWRCFPDGKMVFDPVTGDVMCTGVKRVIKEIYKSFPSGHTFSSFAGLSFLAWYLSGKIRAFDRRGHIAKLCIVFLPLLIAALIGITRVDDYWHHRQDEQPFVIYSSFHPLVTILEWVPHAYFQMMEEPRNVIESLDLEADGHTVKQSEIEENVK